MCTAFWWEHDFSGGGHAGLRRRKQNFKRPWNFKTTPRRPEEASLDPLGRWRTSSTLEGRNQRRTVAFPSTAGAVREPQNRWVCIRKHFCSTATKSSLLLQHLLVLGKSEADTLVLATKSEVVMARKLTAEAQVQNL